MKRTIYLQILLFLALLLYIHSCGQPAKNDHLQNELPFDSEQKGVDFREITKEYGLDDFHYENGSYGEYFLPEITGGPGIAFIDYNNDHWQDILLIGGGILEENTKNEVKAIALYENVEGKQFKDVTAIVGLDKIRSYGFGFTVGDYDNDGDDDFFMTNLYNNRLFRNDGGRFTDVSKEAGIFEESLWSTACLFVDVNQDSWLDIIVGNYAEWSREIDRNLWCSINGITDDYCNPSLYKAEPPAFYINNGDGTFTEEAVLRGFHSPFPKKTLGIIQVDYNHDKWPDLFFANDAEQDMLFQNQGDGTFKDVGLGLGVAFGIDGAPSSGMGTVVGDVKNDGSQAIFVGAFSKEMISVFQLSEYGVFVNNSVSSQIGKQSINTLTFGLSLFDVDLDEDVDLLGNNGHVFEAVEEKSSYTSLKQRPHLFLNNGEGVFADVVTENPSLFPDSILGRSSAYADIDLDGDLDLILTENIGPVYLFENKSAAGNFLRILLKGKIGNSNAIGAKVSIHYGEEGFQARYVKSSEGYLSQSEFPVTFGLSGHEIIDTMRIVWPHGGASEFQGIKAGQFLQIEEGSGEYQVIPLPGVKE